MAGRGVSRGYTLGAILGASIVLASTAYFMSSSYRDAQHLAREQFLDQQALTTRQTARAIEETLRLIERELEHLAGAPAVRRADPAGARAAMELAFAYVTGLSVNDISRSNAQGIIQDTVNSPELIGRDFSFREYFKALRGGAPGPAYEFITFQGLRRGNKGIIVARAIRSERGEFGGPLVFVVEVTNLMKAHLAALPPGMKAWVVDDDGIVLYHPEHAAGTRIVEHAPPDPRFAAFLAGFREAKAVRGEYREASRTSVTLASAEAMTVAGKRLVVVLEAPEDLVQKSLTTFNADYLLGTGIALSALLASLLAIIVLVTKGKRDLEREIAEREIAETRTRESEERFGRLIEYSPMGMMLLDRDNNILYVNRRFVDQLGYPREMIATADLWFKAAYPDKAYRRLQVERWRRHKERAGAARSQSRPSVYSIAGRDGTVHAMELHGALIGDKHLIMFNDVTERTKLEHQLRHAQKMECFGRLAGGVAHDFNNILTTIIGYGEMLGDRLEQDSPLKTYVDTILRSATSAARLTSSLLAFSRRQVLNRRFIDVNEAIRSTKRMLERIVGEDVAVELALADLDVGVIADHSQIEQVLMNLAANARDALPRGGTIRIATAPVRLDERSAAELGAPRPGAYVRISFADTGVGMDNETLERIFEPFFTTKEIGKGTGLGLAIVYGIVSQHDGLVDVKSAPGQGTTFEIYLPASPFPGEDERAEDEFSAGRLPGGSERLLLVEDSDPVRETVGQILRSAGYEVTEARDGDEALTLFAKAGEGIDLVVLDVVMPGLSGADVFRELRGRKPGVKVLFLSGYAQERLSDADILAAGAVAFLPKPVSRRRLLAALRELIDRAAPEPPGP